MLSYKMSRREKVLVLILAIILVAVAWFVFVYQKTANDVVVIDSEIAATESQITVAQARAAQVQEMKAAIEQHKADGVEPVEMPEYDNIQPLMAQLNTILSAASKSTLKFDDLSTGSSGYIERGVSIEFETDSYATAESIVYALAEGKYPCRVDSLAIEDKSSQSSSSSSNASPVKTTVHVTFFESAEE